ncbi:MULTISPECIES: histidine phosphatase family protein [Pontibacillus]|uniref:Fructose-2,6-bisphosphatase n=1 Tax=Pontibacillus marinus BH030004 = DSM 16465 TaxID=1385511 RepID=A0A0A5FW01_9BACI|nr:MULTISPECIES: histidine phosphatase family protein [Pontibacillus]KGX83198.1 fructose-2,6-bisphosphatase [Pontibacillus marinus BH030004 = DSM 16465]QHE52842.1 histidine phosphatase family protein [Pontibacillus sp. HMF3514]
MSTNIYFTRHGETIWNTNKLMQGWKDSPLTDKGIKQAHQLSERLSDIHLNAVYSSTSKRAIDTAEIIKGDRPFEIVKLDSLREISFGNWEGKTFEENKEESPEEWRAFWETPHLFTNNSVESFVKVQERMVNIFKEIVEQHPFQDICIVSHSIALNLLMNYIEKTPLKELWSTPPIPSTSLTLIKANTNYYEILYKYDTSHMVETI